MKARRLATAAAFAVLLGASAPVAFAGTQDPWDTPPPGNCCTSLLDAAVAGVEAALTVL